MKLDQYVVVYPYEMNEYYKKGYKYLAVVSESYTNSESVSLNGSFLNNPISISGNLGSKESRTDKILMELQGTAQILFGAKNGQS